MHPATTTTATAQHAPTITDRLRGPVHTIQALKEHLEETHPDDGSRPAEANDMIISLTLALVDLDECLQREAPALDKILARARP